MIVVAFSPRMTPLLPFLIRELDAADKVTLRPPSKIHFRSLYGSIPGASFPRTPGAPIPLGHLGGLVLLGGDLRLGQQVLKVLVFLLVPGIEATAAAGGSAFLTKLGSMGLKMKRMLKR